jgi:isocitrate lyase
MPSTPGKLLAYNCSPSFNWKKNLDDATIAKFQRAGRDGLQVPVHHPGRHPQQLVQHVRVRPGYARGEGMKHYVEMVQEPEFAARDKGYTFVSHQQEVGTGYFDDVTTVIQGGVLGHRADRLDRRRAVPLISGITEKAASERVRPFCFQCSFPELQSTTCRTLSR